MVFQTFFYYSVLAATQFLMILLWRQLDPTILIVWPVFATSLFAVALVEVVIWMRHTPVMPSAGNPLIRVIGSMAFGCFVYSSILINIDRSRSIAILQWVDSYGADGMSLADLKSLALTSGESESAMFQRLGEQVRFGAVSQNEQNDYVLTPKGQFTIKVIDFFIHWFKLQQNSKDSPSRANN